jgi:protein gp37
MGLTTIEWTATLLPDGTLVPGYTFNGWHGCTKVSPGCEHCYAETLSLRYGKDIWGKGKPRQRMSAKYWQNPFMWDRQSAALGCQLKVFWGSTCDVFDPEVPASWRAEGFALVAATPNLIWLVLTKRPQNVLPMMAGKALPANVWLGTSVEDQRRALVRIPALAKISAPKHFLSVEPLLSPVDLRSFLDRLDWVIVGGESGPGCRAMDPAWARDLRDQCREARVAFFMKQMSGNPKGKTPIPDDLVIREIPSVREAPVH